MKNTDRAPIHLDVTDLTATTALLARWVGAHYGPGATVTRVAPISRHRGSSLGFDVRTGTACERLVIRVAPPGVPRAAPGDVLHQVPVLRAAALSGVPVPTVRWWSDDEHWFGSPFLVVERLSGGPPDAATTDGGLLLGEVVTALAAIHRVDWRRRLPNWSKPHLLATAIRVAEPAVHHGRHEAWRTKSLALHDLLLDSRPAEPELSVIHGDFHSEHWVCDGDRLLGIVGWDLAAIGPSLLDVGRLMMDHDPDCWGPTRRQTMWGPGPAEIADIYRTAAGRSCPDLTWYQALACWRMGVITAMNAGLQRSGEELDNTLESIDEVLELLIERGRELLSSRSGLMRLDVS